MHFLHAEPTALAFRSLDLWLFGNYDYFMLWQIFPIELVQRLQLMVLFVTGLCHLMIRWEDMGRA